MMRIIALAIVGCAHCALRSVEERAAVGECVDAAGVDLYPLNSQLGVFPSPSVTSAESDVQSASLISVVYGTSFKVVSEKLSKEQYVLTQCGTTVPSEAEIEQVAPLAAGYQRKYFTIPLQQVIAGSTTALAFLRRLNLQDRVVRVDSYATGPCWQKALGCGSTLESSWGNASLHAEQLDSAEAVFMDCSGECSSLRARSNAVHFPAVKDNGNLHSAEYIKFLATFFNLEQAAAQAFQSTVAAYTSLTSGSSRPLVAWVQWSSFNNRFEVSLVSYKMQLVSAAGGDNLNATFVASKVPSSVEAVAGNAQAGRTYFISGSEPNAASTLLSVLEDVDVVVDETYAPVPQDYNFSSFLSTFQIPASSRVKFVVNAKVLRVDGTLSASNGLDWFESRVAYPDWAAEGLARYVKGDLSQRRKYFRNIAAGEAVEVITAEMCGVELPSCNSSSFAAPIAAPTPSDDLSTGSRGATAAAVFVAWASAFAM